MKIVCSKNEFCYLVRNCAESKILDNCKGCTYYAVCARGEGICDPTQIMDGIEDICEITNDREGVK